MKQLIKKILRDCAGLDIRRVQHSPQEEAEAAPQSYGTSSIDNLLPSEKLPDEYIRNCKLVVDRYELIRRIAKKLPKDLVATEVGVALGDFSAFLLQELPIKKLYAIDIFELDQVDIIWGKPVEELFGGKSHADFIKERFAEDGRVEVLKGRSDQLLETFENRSFDLIYIDADHSYEGVKKDTLLAAKKIKNDGIIVFNDYAYANPSDGVLFGVPKACHEFMLEHGWEMIYMGLQHNGLYDVALRRHEVSLH